MTSSVTALAGIFDLARTGGSLGQLLVLLEELAIHRELNGLDSVEVFIVNDVRFLPDGISGSPSKANLAMLQTVARAMAGIADCHDLTSWHNERARTYLSTRALWPPIDDILQSRYNYDSTRFIQEYHLRSGSIPRLSVKSELLESAARFVREKSDGILPIAVHVKQVPGIIGQSNANLEAWRALFKYAQSDLAHFFLIGDESTNAYFRDLPNVSICRDLGLTIDASLALIQSCRLFIGMMSGPANMALFGGGAYLIFKNPDHHAAEMMLEIGTNDHYPFALGFQKVLRIWDTHESLIDAFTKATVYLADQ